MRVIDASATIAWLYPGERTPAIQAVFADIAREHLFVPRLWHLEVANVLLLNMKRKKYDSGALQAYMEVLRDLDIQVDAATETQAWKGTLGLANLHGLTLYDASYLELAVRLDAPLATLDDDLRRAASSEGVPLLGM